MVFVLGECGIVAQISDPITDANISEYYISSFYSDHTLVGYFYMNLNSLYFIIIVMCALFIYNSRFLQV